MDILLNPNIAYLFLLAGILFALMGLLTPGTGVFEIGAFFSLALAGYAIYNLSFNGWALALLVLSVAPFIYAIQKPQRGWALGVAIFFMVIGSVFLFSTDSWKPAVNPFLALVASTLAASFLWLVVQKTIQAVSIRPTHDLNALTGIDGEARTKIQEEGSAYVAGELWSAKSANGKPIPAGSQIRVVRREGIFLVVEKINI